MVFSKQIFVCFERCFLFIGILIKNIKSDDAREILSLQKVYKTVVKLKFGNYSIALILCGKRLYRIYVPKKLHYYMSEMESEVNWCGSVDGLSADWASSDALSTLSAENCMTTRLDVAADKVLHANAAFWNLHDPFSLFWHVLSHHRQP